MYREQLKDLWRMRFQKIFDTEKDSYRFYKELLMKHRILLRDTRIRMLIRQLMRDEIQHARMARELLKLVERKSPKIISQPNIDTEINL